MPGAGYELLISQMHLSVARSMSNSSRAGYLCCLPAQVELIPEWQKVLAVVQSIKR
jgi:hypothetical protein